LINQGLYAIRTWSEGRGEEMAPENSALFEFEKAYDYERKRFRIDGHPVSPFEDAGDVHAIGPFTMLGHEVYLIVCFSDARIACTC
jgi:hypothetical protein